MKMFFTFYTHLIVLSSHFGTKTGQGDVMENEFDLPPEFRESFQRLFPHMTNSLRSDPQSLEAVYIYLKLGGEKLARIAIDAFNQTYRLKNAQLQKMRLEQKLLAEQMEGQDDEDEEEEEEDGSDKADDELPDL